MRLIDADELIIPSEEMIARMVINNAPTVDASNIIDGLNNEIDELSENLAWYINERNRLLKDRRSKGEWIIVKDEKWGDNVKCPFCEKELAGTDLNFCCKCGAELIGSEKMNMEADNEHIQ